MTSAFGVLTACERERKRNNYHNHNFMEKTEFLVSGKRKTVQWAGGGGECDMERVKLIL